MSTWTYFIGILLFKQLPKAEMRTFNISVSTYDKLQKVTASFDEIVMQFHPDVPSAAYVQTI